MIFLNRVFSFLLILLLFTSCIATRNSNKGINSKLTVEVENDPDAFDFESLEQQSVDEQLASRGAQSFFTGAIPMLIDGVKFLIEKDKTKYNAEDTDEVITNQFYSRVSTENSFDPVGMQLDNIILTRKFKQKKKSAETTEAYRFEFELDKSDLYSLINNSVFRLKVKDIQLDYLHAKVPDFRWYLPWTLLYAKRKNKVDLDIELIVKADWKDAAGNIHVNQEIGFFYLGLRDVPIDQKEREEYLQGLKGQYLEGYSFLVPRSAGYYKAQQEILPAFGLGNYTISAKVIEASHQKFITRTIRDNSDVIFNEIKNRLN